MNQHALSSLCKMNQFLSNVKIYSQDCIKMTTNHQRGSLDLGADSILVCHVEGLFAYVSRIAWLFIILYRKLLGTICRVACLCITDCLLICSKLLAQIVILIMVSAQCYDFVSQIAWNYMSSCLPMNRILHATLLSSCHFKTGVTLTHILIHRLVYN